MNQKIKNKIKELKKESNIDLINAIIQVNNGYITSKIATELGIGREYLRIMLEKGKT